MAVVSPYNLRQRQKDAFVRMLDLTLSGDGEEVYKVLVLDRPCRDIVSPLIRVNDLRKHGVTLHLLLETERQPIPDVPAVFFVTPTDASIKRIAGDISDGLYDSVYLNFSSALSRPLLEELAKQTVKSDSVSRVAKLYDQYLNFLCLDSCLFSLALPRTYVQLNDPAADERSIQAAISEVVSGLFSVLVTLGVVPIIRCPRGGAAEMVASQLDARIRDHLMSRNNLFSEAGVQGAAMSRPLLCIFDRNFELASAVQHVWTYQPLLADVLGMKLNRVNIQGPATPTAPSGKKSFEIDTDTDPFWEAHRDAQFPKVAEEVEAELQRYKAAVADVTRHTDANADGADGVGSTQGLMSAVSSLPELTERKLIIDKHTNIATALLNQIKARSLDNFYVLEEELLTAKADRAAVNELLGATSKGTSEDKLRLAIVQVLAADAAPAVAESDAVDAALQAAGADTSALAYVRKLRSFNIMRGGAAPGLGAAASSQSQLLDWADKLYGQGINAVAKGVKSLLSGGRQLAVTRVVEALLEARPSPETDDYAFYDPRAAKGSGAPTQPSGAKREAIVFVVGGGNYMEYQSLQEYAGRSPQGAKTIVYGGTDILSGGDFLTQLTELGRKAAGLA